MKEDEIERVLNYLKVKLKNHEIESINMIIRNGKSDKLRDLLIKVGVKEVLITNLD